MLINRSDSFNSRVNYVNYWIFSVSFSHWLLSEFVHFAIPGRDVSAVSAHYSVKALNALKLCKKCAECAEL